MILVHVQKMYKTCIEDVQYIWNINRSFGLQQQFFFFFKNEEKAIPPGGKNIQGQQKEVLE